MLTNGFIIGDTARISVALTHPDTGSAVDPGGLTLQVRAPGGSLTTLTYGIDAAMVKEAVGQFRADIDLATAGVWHWRWTASGANKGVAEGQLTAKASQVL